LAAGKLWSQLERSPRDLCSYWTQDLFGRRSTHLGAVHGFVGTALPLIRLLCRQPSQRGLESAISAPNTAGAVIYAKDLSRVTAFYREVAVLPVTHSEIDYAILESETFQRVVHAIPAGIAASIDVASPPMRREDAAVKLIFPVPSIDASRALAALHGGALNPPEREWQFRGRRICDGHDPEGNVIQLREHAGA